MSNIPVAYAIFRDGQYYDAIHPSEQEKTCGEYDTPLYVQEHEKKDEISPFKALDFIRDNAPVYAQAKADVMYMTEYRKSIKADLMSKCENMTLGDKETYAYAHPSYKLHLDALKQAIAQAEKLRWLMVAAEAKIEVWRSLESSARAEGRSTQ